MVVCSEGGRIPAMALAKRSLNLPSDSRGDPCLPKGNSWTVFTCNEDPLARVIAINLTNFGVGGLISDHIANLTPVSSMHVEDNGLTDMLSESLGNIAKLKELLHSETLIRTYLHSYLTPSNAFTKSTYLEIGKVLPPHAPLCQENVGSTARTQLCSH
ncbi:hypothetical protein U9M48_005069 [Paspalum notatum var. saurae]|uniref:Uncharacterized protein n=1 Tax=Paspalum notatum var. saurae TaxID=547442 RepID=A0AAQ3PWV5_PASNO